MSTTRARAVVLPSVRHQWVTPVASKAALPGPITRGAKPGPRRSVIWPERMYATPGRWSWRCRAMLPPGAMVSSRSRRSRPCRDGKSWWRGRAPSRFSARTPWVTVAAGAGAPADRPGAPAGVAWTSWGGHHGGLLAPPGGRDRQEHGGKTNETGAGGHRTGASGAQRAKPSSAIPIDGQQGTDAPAWPQQG